MSNSRRTRAFHRYDTEINDLFIRDFNESYTELYNRLIADIFSSEKKQKLLLAILIHQLTSLTLNTSINSLDTTISLTTDMRLCELAANEVTNIASYANSTLDSPLNQPNELKTSVVTATAISSKIVDCTTEATIKLGKAFRFKFAEPLQNTCARLQEKSTVNHPFKHGHR